MAIHLPVFLLGLLLVAIALHGFLAQAIQKELGTTEMNPDEIILNDHSILSTSTDPSQVIQLSWHPRVFLYKSFLSDEECDHLISLADGMRSNDLLSNDLSKVHNNGGLSLDTDDPIVGKIEEKISAWTFLPKEHSTSLQVQHIFSKGPKQNYNHSNTKSVKERDEPLLATIILHLSNVNQGGQILFPNSENRTWSDCTKSSEIARPRKGNAIVIFNMHLNATLDKSSFHARCPVLDGEMWSATKLFYMKGVGVSSGKDVLQSEDSDCTDEDENCPSWAVMGECERNSVFMIGSPDYYGTCRKSCNAC